MLVVIQNMQIRIYMFLKHLVIETDRNILPDIVYVCKNVNISFNWLQFFINVHLSYQTPLQVSL